MVLSSRKPNLPYKLSSELLATTFMNIFMNISAKIILKKVYFNFRDKKVLF